jgi:D-inositol-3-phosphate glycosyltransferase
VHLPGGEQKDIPKEDIYHHLFELTEGFLRFQEREGIRYDLVHSHYWLSAHVGQLLGSSCGIPQIATFHTLGAVKNRARPEEKEPELRISTERESAQAADRLISFTEEERDDLVNLYGASRDRILVIPAGVDTDLFRPIDKQESRSLLGLGKGKTMLFAGRIEPIKGIDVLLGAVQSLNNGDENVRLLIVGGDLEGNGEVARLRSEVYRMGIADRVTFYGAAEQDKMPLFYNAADVCVVPSLHESFCFVALEAMACGTPVVASKVGGLKTTIEDGKTGYLVAEHSSRAFAHSVKRILEDGDLQHEMGKAARNRALQFRWSTVAEKMLVTYKLIIDDFNPRSWGESQRQIL